MFCLVNSITQSWMSERLGRRSWLRGCGRGSGFHFSASAKPKESCQAQLLLSTLPALPPLARKETGFTQTLQGLSQGWPAHFPPHPNPPPTPPPHPHPTAPPFLNARQKSTSATLITANTLINNAPRWIYC